jgi:hypothetical protein
MHVVPGASGFDADGGSGFDGCRRVMMVVPALMPGDGSGLDPASRGGGSVFDAHPGSIFDAHAGSGFNALWMPVVIQGCNPKAKFKVEFDVPAASLLSK